MKIGWVSASPAATTGYGTQTKEVCSRLLQQHDVVCIGQTGSVIVWGGRQTVDTLHGELEVIALSDPRSAVSLLNKNYIPTYELDIIIGFMDAFGLEYLNDVNVPVIGWIPIDGPFTPSWKHYVKNFYKVMTYSEFGYQELLKFFPPSKVGNILHGIDTDTFKPVDKDKIREELQAKYSIPKDGVLYLNVGANSGPRKELPLLMHTFKRFVDAGFDNAHLFMHTNAYSPSHKGYDLLQWREMLNMKKHIHFPTSNPIVNPVSNERLAELYTAADVYVQNSVAEGCGLPILEALSCKTPVITAWNSAQKELVEGHGWVTDNVPKDMYFQVPVYVPQLTHYPVPDQKSLLANLQASLIQPELRDEFGQKGFKFVRERHSFDKLMPQWFDMLDRVQDDLNLFNTLKRDISG